MGGTGSSFLFVNWDAFPELGRVSVQPEKLLPMLDDRPGTYVVTREAGVTETVELSKGVVCILPVGTYVDIVEVVHRLEQKRWRGRLEKPVKPERKKEEGRKIEHVQAAEDIHYGSVGIVPKGATGVVLGKF